MDEYSTIPIDVQRTEPSDPGDHRAAALVVLRGPDLGRRFPLLPGVQTVGRTIEAAVYIHDQSLSRRHCEVELSSPEGPNACVIRDLNSTNGTLVNGKRAVQTDLRDGDKITLGDIILKFVLLDTIDEDFHHEVADRMRMDRGTGLLNLSTFYDELDKAMYRARADGIPIAVLMFDVDALKQVNDSYGHQLGTHVVHTVAERLHAACGSVHGVAAIYGGDEFIAYLPETQEAAALTLGRALCAEVAALEFAPPGGGVARVTLSAGVAEFPRDGAVREVLVRRADVALYAAKRQGKNRVVPYQAGLENDTSPS